jgi:hypothetical protein
MTRKDVWHYTKTEQIGLRPVEYSRAMLVWFESHADSQSIIY